MQQLNHGRCKRPGRYEISYQKRKNFSQYCALAWSDCLFILSLIAAGEIFQRARDCV